jgi:hypothetical protein
MFYIVTLANVAKMNGGNMASKCVVRLPEAVGICEECGKKNSRQVGNELISYCEHGHVGGIFIEGIWSLYFPVTIEVFNEMVGRRRRHE